MLVHICAKNVFSDKTAIKAPIICEQRVGVYDGDNSLQTTADAFVKLSAN